MLRIAENLRFLLDHFCRELDYRLDFPRLGAPVAQVTAPASHIPQLHERHNTPQTIAVSVGLFRVKTLRIYASSKLIMISAEEARKKRWAMAFAARMR